jgi:hypothetical protein
MHFRNSVSYIPKPKEFRDVSVSLPMFIVAPKKFNIITKKTIIIKKNAHNLGRNYVLARIINETTNLHEIFR